VTCSLFLEDLYGRYYLKRTRVDEEHIKIDVKEMFFGGVDVIQVTGVHVRQNSVKTETSGFTTRQITDHLYYHVGCSWCKSSSSLC
jgi:hypothetical protein